MWKLISGSSITHAHFVKFNEKNKIFNESDQVVIVPRRVVLLPPGTNDAQTSTRVLIAPKQAFGVHIASKQAPVCSKYPNAPSLMMLHL